MDLQSAYDELGVGEDATPEVIKAQYRKLVLDLHPDRNNGKNEARLKRITTAYHTLKDTVQHTLSTKQQREAQNTRNAQRKQGRKPNYKMQEGKTPEEDWSRFTSEFEKDETFWKEYEKEFWQDYEERLRSNAESTEKARKDPVWQKTRGPKRNTTKPPEPKARQNPHYSINIDESLCIGCCSCETIAPKMFAVNKEAKTNPKSSVIDQIGCGVEKMMDAAQTCPTKAIIIDDRASRVRMYPL